ncbi:MAG: DUF4199 domain-containing protein [Flammeovirgaceae bacterium]
MMRKFILKFGLFAVLILVGVGVLSALVFGKSLNYSQQEILGFVSIFLALSMVVIAIKQYKTAQGRISFNEGLKIGLGISVLGALGFGLFSIGYMEVAGDEFFQLFYEQAKTDPSRVPYNVESFEAFMADMKADNPMYTSSIFQGVVMFLTVFLIGLIVSIVSSMMMKSKRRLQTA